MPFMLPCAEAVEKAAAYKAQGGWSQRRVGPATLPHCRMYGAPPHLLRAILCHPLYLQLHTQRHSRGQGTEITFFFGCLNFFSKCAKKS